MDYLYSPVAYISSYFYSTPVEEVKAPAVNTEILDGIKKGINLKPIEQQISPFIVYDKVVQTIKTPVVLRKVEEHEKSHYAVHNEVVQIIKKPVVLRKVTVQKYEPQEPEWIQKFRVKVQEIRNSVCLE